MFYFLKITQSEQDTQETFFHLYRNKRLQRHADGQNFFEQLVKNEIRTYGSIQKIATGQGGCLQWYRTGCLLDHPCFKENCKQIAIDLNKQVPNDTAIQQCSSLLKKSKKIPCESIVNVVYVFYLVSKCKSEVIQFLAG